MCKTDNLKKPRFDAFTEKYPEGVEVDTTIGEVKISRRSIRESLAHTIYNDKADAVLSLPEGIKNAAYIGKLKDFEGNGIVNHYFAYPIQYDGEKRYVFCRVREQPFEERRFYIHDIFSDKEITEKSNTLSQTQPPANGQVQLRGVAIYRAILTNFFAQGNNNNLKKSAVQNSVSPKRKSKGKWRTIGSASSREELQKLFKENGMSSGIIQEDGSIKILGTGEILQDRIRVQKVRWQYGYYEIDSKNSQTGDGSTAIINLVDDKNLTEQDKLLQEFGKNIGVNVVFFKNPNKDFHGAYRDGIIYLNVNSTRSLTQTFAHEIFHFLAANNPKLFSEMSKAAGITENQLANYLAETQRTDVTKTADVTEEMIADSMQEILNRVARKDKSLVERFFAWLKDTFSKFKNFFVNPKGKLTRGQYAKMADVFGRMAVKFTDADGKKIFRYNTRTHNLELANGESLESLLEEIRNEGTGEQGFFNLQEAKFSRNNDDAVNRFFLPEGYRTESGRTVRNSNSEEFIVDENGNKDLWQIPESVEQNSNGKIKALPVRLQVGQHFGATNTGSGFVHIARKHLRAIREHGFDNAFDFVDYVIKNFNKGYEHPRINNRVILFCNDNSRGFMPIELIRERNYYRIVTAYPKDGNVNGESIYDESETSSAATTDDTTGQSTNSNVTVGGTNNNGGVNSLAANVETNSPSENITQSADNDNTVTLTNAKFSFAGKNALTANQQALAQARRMEKDGKSRDEIFKATGWFKGKDDKWRFEITDNFNQIDIPLLKRVGSTKLGYVYKNPQLYAAYPNLASVKISSQDMEINILGEVRSGEINLNKKRSEEDLKRTMVHEIQHIIQNHEGFAVGGTDSFFTRAKLFFKGVKYDSSKNNFEIYEQLGGEQEAREVSKRADISTKIRQAENEFDETIEKLNKFKSKQSSELKNKIDECISAIKNLDDELAEEIMEELPTEAVELLETLDSALMDINYFGEDETLTPVVHDDNAIIVFGGKKYSMASVDNTENLTDNNDKILERLFEKFKFNEAYQKMVRETVAREISSEIENGNIDLSKMSDPIARDKARDRLPYIRKLLTQYHSKIIQNSVPYKNYYAVKIEYARRCFENDERIRTESANEVVRNEEQRRIRENRTSTFERNQSPRVGGIIRGGNVGLSRNVGGEVSGARKHFLKLYEEVQNENRRSENKNQGVFKFSIGSSDNSQSSNEDSTGKWFSGIWDKFARALNLKGDRIVTEEMENERLRSKREKAMDNFIKDPSAENLMRLKELKISGAMLRAYRKGEDYRKDVGLSDVIWRSPSRVAERVAAFRAYFTMADRAMDKLVRLRDQFAAKLNVANDLLKNKDDNETLTNLLLDGDANEIEYGILTEQEKNSIIKSSTSENITQKLQQERIRKICEETGVNENVAQAYVKIRQLMTKAYHALNDAKRRPKIESKYLDNDAINELKNNKFVSITKISDTTDDKGRHLVTCKKYHHTFGYGGVIDSGRNLA